MAKSTARGKKAAQAKGSAPARPKAAALRPRKTPTPDASAANKSIIVKAPTAALYRPKQGPQTLYILSDSTGNLPRHMLTAFLTQFPRKAFSVRALTFLQSDAKLERAMDEIAKSPGIVFHALVSPGAKQMVADRCNFIGVPHCDLTGDFVNFLSRESGIAPTPDPSQLHRTGETYHQRIKAIEFALAHDDGLGLETLHEADLVLTGISRTSKTPTTIFLAQQGYKVGNVALSMDVPPPRELLELPKNKVAGLMIDASQLIEIRTRRQREWGMGDSRYNDDDYVEREIQWSRRLFTQHAWPVVNVTDQAIEETAARVLEIVGIIKPLGQ